MSEMTVLFHSMTQREQPEDAKKNTNFTVFVTGRNILSPARVRLQSVAHAYTDTHTQLL